MIMPSHVHKLALTAHVTTAVGWIGAAAAFIGLAVVGLTNQDPQTVRGAYLVMEPLAWLVLVPLALASLLTGLVMSFGSSWGLLRHYWVIFKFVITVFATTILLTYMETFRLLTAVAADPNADLTMVRNASPMLHAVLAVLGLLAATVLAVYKPRGLTRYGWRKRHEQRMESRAIPPRGVRTQSEANVRGAHVQARPGAADESGVQPERGLTIGTRWRLYVLVGIVGLLLLFIILHLIDGGIPDH